MTAGQSTQQAAAQVGRQIKEARKAKGMSMQQVADRSGLYRQRLSEIEAGKGNITIATLAAIAAALETTFEVG